MLMNSLAPSSCCVCHAYMRNKECVDMKMRIVSQLFLRAVCVISACCSAQLSLHLDLGEVTNSSCGPLSSALHVIQ